MIFIIDDDVVMAQCIKLSIDVDCKIFSNGVEAMYEIAKGSLPKLVFLDILLDGPDGFTFLHELVSYPDTKNIPVVVVSSLELKEKDLSAYGVVKVLNKDTMVPQDIKDLVRHYAK